ncbi:hypothetical protein RO3G_02504 [Rhizopus delemar RA 99-880]|uniref:Uncharacterized protein n=3 Tax=Rhizopus TaxID=4842 RepID=I1BNM0_RHIO9|nr:hypothetical protein RO3G_02504 [Rhizopus delemar RA 99-880]|eukprot:EIE77800.1 hypothetical protein RO3G_02504 [Rhizopus delemar RA 99-880]
MVVFRLLIGIVDTCVVTVGTFDDGTCDYDDPKYWGPVYTLYDTLIDLYVTFVISLILLSHIRSLALDDMRINIILYTSVIYHNVIRSVLLTIVNLISAIFMITRYTNDYIMLVWPIINIVFVVLVGYDSDVTKAIRKLQQMRWQRNSNSNVSNHASIAQPVRKEREISFIKETTTENQSCSQSLHTEKYSLEAYEEKASQSVPAKSTRNTSYDTDSTRIET